MDKETLKKSLEATLAATDEMLRLYMDDAKKMGINPYDLRDRHGVPMLLPLVQTRATTLAALTSFLPR
jgi:hypothetical protein